ncbi:MAG: DUF3179 domain-containing protein [Tabrizicola sp.]|nr:DUF3179 domain-containing protein [Tabrizicola sp.]
MQLYRRHLLRLALAATVLPRAGIAETDQMYEALVALVDGDSASFTAGLEAIRQRGNPDMTAGLIEAMRFTSAPDRPIVEVLEAITGQKGGDDWFDWMLWQERHPEVVPHPSYARMKRDLYLRIDPNFDGFLKPEWIPRERMKIRLEEITWGGVVKDGIPSLDNPAMVAADSAAYLQADDLVFGIAINGDVRAYPLRIMGWHEMFNDVIGGVPVALAYCTLCGSGILFETGVKGRRKPFVFGSSGFLYRSNKLMFDRETLSLWNQFTGKPVVGPLVESGITLEQRPVAIAAWKDWRAANPGTSVLSLDTGYSRDYGSGVVYNEYFASKNLMFPTNVDQSKLRQKDYVFGLRLFGGAKAWPLAAFRAEPVINDTLAGQPVVLIGDPEGRTVRAYERGEERFAARGGALLAADGAEWQATEEALVAPDGRRLGRLAGQISYWFAWNGYVGAESELYGG